MAKILIVDDSEDLQEIFSTLLQRNGKEAISVLTGKDLVDKIEANSPDLILLDIMLKGHDGRTLCKEIKANPKTRNIPIILISASTKLLENYKDCNADDIIEKPFNIDEVTEKIDEVLDSR